MQAHHNYSGEMFYVYEFHAIWKSVFSTVSVHDVEEFNLTRICGSLSVTKGGHPLCVGCLEWI